MIPETNRRTGLDRYRFQYRDLFVIPNENWTASGVATVIRKRLRNRILEYTWISPRIVQGKVRRVHPFIQSKLGFGLLC
jgi:hypothetical protein